MDSAWFRSTFLRVYKFLQIKEGDLNSRVNNFCRKSELFGRPFCISILRVFYFQIHSYSLDFNTFCIIKENFSQSWNFNKLKRGDLISVGNQFCRKSELFGLPFCISFLNTLWTQIHNHSLDFNAFCMIQEYFLRVLKFLQINMEEPNFSREPLLQKVWILWFRFLYFNFKSFMDPN